VLDLATTIKDKLGKRREHFGSRDALLVRRRMDCGSPVIPAVVYIGSEMSGMCAIVTSRSPPMIHEEYGMLYEHTCDLAVTMKCAGCVNNVSSMGSIAAC